MPEFNLKGMIDLKGIKFNEMGVKLCATTPIYCALWDSDHSRTVVSNLNIKVNLTCLTIL